MATKYGEYENMMKEKSDKTKKKKTFSNEVLVRRLKRNKNNNGSNGSNGGY